MEKAEILTGDEIDRNLYDFLYSNGNTKYFCGKDSNQKEHGVEVIRDTYENLLQVNNWFHGVLHGSSRTWYIKGYKDSPILQEKEQVWFVQGKRNGIYLQWYPDGQLKERKTFKDDKLDGLFEIWYPNGSERENELQLKELRHYVDCKLNGLHEKWYPDGQDKSRKNYIMGKLQ